MNGTFRVIEQRPLAKGVDPDVIDILEGALAKARDGEIRGFVLVAEGEDGCATYSVAGVKDRFRTMGFITNMLHRLQSD